METRNNERPRYATQLWAGPLTLTVSEDEDREVAKNKARWIRGYVLDRQTGKVFVGRYGSWASLNVAKVLGNV